MKYLTFDENKGDYTICFLVPFINKREIEKEYIEPFNINKNDVLILDLYKDPLKKKTSAKDMKNYLKEEVEQTLIQNNVKYVFVCDSEYFKQVSRQNKADSNVGYVLDSIFEDIKVTYIPSFKSIFYNPDSTKEKISLGINAILNHMNGSYKEPGNSIIHSEYYPKTYDEISNALDKLLDMNVDLTSDIEAFSLKHYNAGIGTICYCWDEHNGIAFPVDYTKEGLRGEPNIPIRNLLINFLKRFKKKIIFHNIAYDGYVLVYQLFMQSILDTKGMYEGFKHLLSNWEDTKLISYLATNSCAGNKLGLKDLSQEFAGNYALTDIKDITRVNIDELLRYNLIDGLSTWYVYKKYRPIMVQDDQLNLYENHFKKYTVDIIQMQLTGLPVNINRVIEVEKELKEEEKSFINKINSFSLMEEFIYSLKEKWVIEKNNKYKKKRVTIEDANIEFNLNSNIQLQSFLYEFLNLPVIDYTETKQPSTDTVTLEKLINHTDNESTKDILKSIVNFKGINKINSSFIPALLNAYKAENGWHYLFGNFNLGGTVSGRLSSSNPNLQNLPSTGSKYAKIIKSCFQAPPGYIFCGLDFSSLEDRISALTTKDPNKIKVYTDGYEGHSMRAYSYFGDKMPDIDGSSVESINSIDKKYKSFRQLSKAPTFALTYQGTYITLINNCGFDEETAKMIEKKYHELYKVSDDWVNSKLKEATKTGYISAAFGLRVRTPLLHQVILGNSKTPYEASAEGRTAGNALGQSWCLLNNRAASEFMQKVRNSEYKQDIQICAQIHDAQYYIIKDDIDIVIYLNEHLVNAVNWQDHPDIYHESVGLGGELSIFYPTWNNEIEIPNKASKEDIFNIIKGNKND